MQHSSTPYASALQARPQLLIPSFQPPLSSPQPIVYASPSLQLSSPWSRRRPTAPLLAEREEADRKRQWLADEAARVRKEKAELQRALSKQRHDSALQRAQTARDDRRQRRAAREALRHTREQQQRERRSRRHTPRPDNSVEEASSTPCARSHRPLECDGTGPYRAPRRERRRRGRGRRCGRCAMRWSTERRWARSERCRCPTPLTTTHRPFPRPPPPSACHRVPTRGE